MIELGPEYKGLICRLTKNKNSWFVLSQLLTNTCNDYKLRHQNELQNVRYPIGIFIYIRKCIYVL